MSNYFNFSIEDSEIKKQQDMTWLEHLQRNSWEPEVIISGISFLTQTTSRFLSHKISQENRPNRRNICEIL